MQRFAEHRISGLPIVNDRNEIIAFISAREMMRYIGRHKPIIFPSLNYFSRRVVWLDKVALEHKVRHLFQCNVMEVATRRVTTVREDAQIDDVATLLSNKHINHILVGRDGVIVGIVCRSDIIRYISTLVPDPIDPPYSSDSNGRKNEFEE